MRLHPYLLRFGLGLAAGVIGWEGPRAWLVTRAEARRAADALAPHAGAHLERTAAGLTDAARLVSGFALLLAAVLTAVVVALTMAILTPDQQRRTWLALWIATGLGVLLGGVSSLYARMLL